MNDTTLICVYCSDGNYSWVYANECDKGRPGVFEIPTTTADLWSSLERLWSQVQKQLHTLDDTRFPEVEE